MIHLAVRAQSVVLPVAVSASGKVAILGYLPLAVGTHSLISV